MLQGLIGAVVGGLGMLAMIRFAGWPHLRLSPAAWLMLVLALPFAFLVMIAVHEVGHLLAGTLARFRPLLLIVGPVKLERTSSGWRPGLNRVFPLSGGLAGSTPEGTRRLRERMTVLIAGGPVASIASGLAVFAALAASGFTRQTTLSGVEAVAFLLAFVFVTGSLGIGCVALVPGQGHGFLSDGARILRFLRKGPGVDGEVAILGIVGASMGGQRPRDWDPGLVTQALHLDPATPFGASARILAYAHALDCGDIARARDHLTAAIDNQDVLPVMSRPALMLQAATFEAIYDRDPVSARRRLEQAHGGTLVSPHARPLAEGAILAAEGNARAAELLDKASSELPRAIDRGGALLAADLIANTKRTLEASK